jgi:3-hydroxyisobutyrate dehydrogenase-like beta-hydroxyacid dehydrogenase
LELADEKGVKLEVAKAANDLYLKAMNEDHGEDDFCAVYKSI